MKNEDTYPIRYSVEVTPSDTDDIKPCRALSVTVAGLVKVTYANGVVDSVQLAAGMWHGMYVKRVWSAVTTATGIHAGY